MSESSQIETIEFLSNRAFGRASEIIRTHASVIFLSGERAFKLKRAVRYSFLDYSTPERRRQACEDEVALNRRTAPGLYVAVRSVTRTSGGELAIDGHGDPLEWLVEMRRFPQENLFSAMVAAGTLTVPLMNELAERILEFHRTADRTLEHGGRAGVTEVISINEQSFAATGLAGKDIVAASRTMLDRVGPLLERRRREGHVRQCHGDLHLGNIVCLDGRPTLFDGIEFSRSIACIDVLYDLAFLLMDLWHRRQPHLASAVFNRYLDLSDEADGVAALPLFLSLRAAIRAHVAAAAGRAESGAYLDLARQLLQPTPPRLVAVGGLSGTGKSRLAAALAPSVGPAPGARVLRSDVIRKRLLGRAPEERLPAEGYTAEMNGRVYDALAASAAEALSAGHSAILDAVAARPHERADFEAIAASAKVPFIGIWLEAPSKLLESRVALRGADASDATPDIVRRQRHYDTGDIGWVRVDAAGSIEATLDLALAVLSGR